MWRLAILLTLAGCARPDAVAPAPQIEVTCAPNAPPPRALPAIRTPEQIAQYATAVEIAREAEVRARNDCARKLQELQDQE